ncbi:MAG: SCO family protein [Limnohabitans sp.]|nr:SCO family protein [Limnohabitans sp.]
MNSRRRQVLVAALSAVSVLGLIACDPNKPQFVSIDITGAEYARGFQLPDQNGQMRSLEEFKGKVVAVFFGYTQCPDVCPTTLTEWVEIKRQLGADGDRLQGIFITVDPARDTPEVLKAYMGNFDPSFLALIPGSPEALAQVAKEYKIIYKKVDGKTPGSYTMDHSAGSYLYDPQGRLRLYSRYGNSVDGLVTDIKQLLR